MRRPRITVRHIMIVVFLIAALLGAFEAGRRYEQEQRPQRVYTSIKVPRSSWQPVPTASSGAAPVLPAEPPGSGIQRDHSPNSVLLDLPPGR